jgi:hypothetical protein
MTNKKQRRREVQAAKRQPAKPPAKQRAEEPAKQPAKRSSGKHKADGDA